MYIVDVSILKYTLSKRRFNHIPYHLLNVLSFMFSGGVDNEGMHETNGSDTRIKGH